jgi:hypothetical protein
MICHIKAVQSITELPFNKKSFWPHHTFRMHYIYCTDFKRLKNILHSGIQNFTCNHLKKFFSSFGLYLELFLFLAMILYGCNLLLLKFQV